MRGRLPLSILSSIFALTALASVSAIAEPIPESSVESLIELISQSSRVRTVLRETSMGMDLARSLIGRPIEVDGDYDRLISALRSPTSETIVPALTGEAWLQTLALEEEAAGHPLADDGPIADYRATREEFLNASAASTRVKSAPVTPVTDQGDTLQCWAVSATARMDVDASRRAGGLLKLSPRYTVYAKTRAEVVDLIMKGQLEAYEGSLCEGCARERIYYEQGGVFADAAEAAKLYGAMPESAYGGFPQHDEEMFRELNRVIAEYAAPHGGSPVRTEVDRKVTEVLNRYWGKPPASFEFHGRTFTAQEFLAEYLPEWRHASATELAFEPGAAEGEAITETFDGARFRGYRTGDHSKLMSALSQSLRKGLRPLIVYKVLDGAQANGVIGFAAHGLTPPASLDWNASGVLEHYVLAIGGQWDEAGNLQRILVKNTWATDAANHFGIHWIEADYFPYVESVEIAPSLESRFRSEGLIR